MSYVSEIKTPLAEPGVVRRLLKVDFGKDRRFTAIVDGHELLPSKLIRAENVLGVCPEIGRLGGVVLRLDAHEAKLHDYVTGIETCAAVHVGSSGFEHISVVDESPERVVLNLHDTTIQFGGLLGSVVERRGLYGFPEAYSLWETLVWLSQKSGVAVMRYPSIKLISNLLEYETTLHLVNSSESNRFFTKMCLGVMKC